MGFNIGYNNIYNKNCNGCTDRVLGCHSNCKKYLEFKNRIDDINKAKRKDNAYKYYYRDAKLTMHKSRCTNGIMKSGK